ncbi:hypothetical protein CLJ1_1830 [Pseudomonas paraeruginosa]|nr:hypothetical protein CLJ1_1830 [Pseudomonas aeruginosa]
MSPEKQVLSRCSGKSRGKNVAGNVTGLADTRALPDSPPSGRGICDAFGFWADGDHRGRAPPFTEWARSPCPRRRARAGRGSEPLHIQRTPGKPGENGREAQLTGGKRAFRSRFRHGFSDARQTAERMLRVLRPGANPG